MINQVCGPPILLYLLVCTLISLKYNKPNKSTDHKVNHSKHCDKVFHLLLSFNKTFNISNIYIILEFVSSIRVFKMVDLLSLVSITVAIYS